MDDNLDTRSGSYTYRDCPAVTALHATRTAASMVGFFLPYLCPGMRVLDCGCGPGSITVGLAEHVAPGEVIGIDLDPTHIALAQRCAADTGRANVRFARADIYTLPFPDATFDAVFCQSLLSHLREPAQALREIRRILQPAGLLGAREVDTEGMLIAPFAPSCYRCGTCGSRWCAITAGIRALANSSVRWCATPGFPSLPSRPRMNVLEHQDCLGGRRPARWWSIGR
jgi:SAM-dependent methyltransferase